jgi:hypothetical protein
MDSIRNFEDRLEADTLLSNITFSSFLLFLRASSDATEGFYIGFIEPNLVTVDSQIIDRTFRSGIQSYENRWNIALEGIVIGILN